MKSRITGLFRWAALFILLVAIIAKTGESAFNYDKLGSSSVAKDYFNEDDIVSQKRNKDIVFELYRRPRLKISYIYSLVRDNQGNTYFAASGDIGKRRGVGFWGKADYRGRIEYAVTRKPKKDEIPTANEFCDLAIDQRYVYVSLLFLRLVAQFSHDGRLVAVVSFPSDNKAGVTELSVWQDNLYAAAGRNDTIFKVTMDGQICDIYESVYLSRIKDFSVADGKIFIMGLERLSGKTAVYEIQERTHRERRIFDITGTIPAIESANEMCFNEAQRRFFVLGYSQRKDRIMVYNGRGVFLYEWGKNYYGDTITDNDPRLFLPHSLFVDKSSLFLADSKNGRIREYSLQGKLLGNIYLQGNENYKDSDREEFSLSAIVLRRAKDGRNHKKHDVDKKEYWRNYMVGYLRKAIKEIGYSSFVEQELIKLFEETRLTEDYLYLRKMQRLYLAGDISIDDLAEEERKILQRQKAEILSFFDYDLLFFDLERAFSERRINCVGLTQIAYLVARALNMEFVTAIIMGGDIRIWDLDSITDHAVGFIELSDGGYFWFDFAEFDLFVPDEVRPLGKPWSSSVFLRDKGKNIAILFHFSRGSSSIIAQRMYSQGIRFLLEGDYEQAIAFFGQARADDPKNPYCYLNRAIAYVGVGNFSYALEDLNTAIRLEPRFAYGFLWRAYLLLDFAQDKIGKAIKDATAAMELGSLKIKVKALILRAQAYFLQQEYDKAIEDCDRAISLAPSLADGYFIRSQIFRIMNKPEMAEKDYRRAKEMGIDIDKQKRYLSIFGRKNEDIM